MKIPTILFGASRLGEIAYYALRESHNIYYFLDNDPKKNDTIFCNTKVILPKNIHNIDEYQVIITSSYITEIAQQLIDMGFFYFLYFELANTSLLKAESNSIIISKCDYAIQRYIADHKKIFPFETDYQYALDEDSVAKEIMKAMNVLAKMESITYNLALANQLDKIQNLVTLFSNHFSEIKNVIDSISLIFEGKIDESYILTKKSLEGSPYHINLLYNMSYLSDCKGFSEEKVNNYIKAKMLKFNDSHLLKDNIFLKKNNSSSMKVLHGTIEVANQVNTITQGLRNIGIDAKFISYYKNQFQFTDELLDRNDYQTISQLISDYDIFHFHFGTSLSINHTDLPLLNELGKRVIMHHWGSEARAYSWVSRYNPYTPFLNDEIKVRRRLEFLGKYIPNCIISDNEYYDVLKEYYQNVFIIRQSIDLLKVQYYGEQKSNSKFTIVHAPTNPKIKGTDYVLKAIEELRDKYDFDFFLVQGMSHQEALKIYQKADLIVDEILSGCYGILSIEAMALGKPVMNWICDFMKETYPKELPIISVNPQNIKEKLEYAINNREMLRELGLRGRKYVETYHDISIISNQLSDLYKKI